MTEMGFGPRRNPLPLEGLSGNVTGGQPHFQTDLPTSARNSRPQGLSIWLWVKTNGIPFWLVGAPPISVYFSGDWDVHGGYGVLTHGHIASYFSKSFEQNSADFDGLRAKAQQISLTIGIAASQSDRSTPCCGG